ncbi:hypothetical protein R3X27_00190 [Tropicimonas sp. TH_r6]|uniref:hypothetical protein n=1 Tax=Tropicimonas sp. TH_r6 TaxID=3082085 RepID=UPI002952D1ED|nr:hypothetical protein [Tropicimonas sp. TH_r6]MDV7141088.1 hypothetical protein [Tropicimonas sp. TH_r6]
MFKTLTAATLSIALATTSLAPSPAMAQNRENVAPILFGLSVLAIAAAAMHDNNDKKKARKKHRPAPPVARAKPAPAVQAPVQPPKPKVAKVKRPREAVVVKPAKKRRVLPRACERNFNVANGGRTFLMKRCLINEGVRVSKLPDRCERAIEVRGGRKTLTGWKRNCLKREGFRIQ